MRIPHDVFKLGRLFTPLFYLKDFGKKTAIYHIDETTKFKVRVNSYDKQAIYEVWKWKEYEGDDFQINPQDCVIEIGAHIGAFSVYAARRAREGRVYSFEPDRANYALLKKNIKINKLKNIHIFPQAMSEKSGRVMLYKSDVHNMTHSLYENNFKNSQSVTTITLSEFIKSKRLKRVNFLKIDAEGAEYEIILTTPPEILKLVDKAIIEYHDYLNLKHSHKDLVKHLEKSGFEVSLGMHVLIRKTLKMGLIKAKRL